MEILYRIKGLGELPAPERRLAIGIVDVLKKKLPHSIEENPLQRAYPVLLYFRSLRGELSPFLKACLAYRMLLFASLVKERNIINPKYKGPLFYALAAYALTNLGEEKAKNEIDKMVKNLNEDMYKNYNGLLTSLKGNPIGIKLINTIRENAKANIPGYKKEAAVSETISNLIMWSSGLDNLRESAEKLIRDKDASFTLNELKLIAQNMKKGALKDPIAIRNFTTICHLYQRIIEEFQEDKSGISLGQKERNFLEDIGNKINNSINNFNNGKLQNIESEALEASRTLLFREWGERNEKR